MITVSRLLVFQILGFLLLLSLARGAFSLAPWVPTRSNDLEQIGEIVDMREGQVFLEFGCGNSRVCRYIAERTPTAQVIGIEMSFPLYVWSQVRQKMTGPSNLTIIWKDGFAYDLSRADVIYTFGLPDTINIKLKKKLLAEMKSGAKFVSYVFAIDEREGGATEHIQSRHNEGMLHVYTRG